MDNLLMELEALTLDMIRKLDRITYVDMVDFVELRQDLHDRIAAKRDEIGTLTINQQQVLSTILEQGSDIITKMTEFKNEAGEWLERNGKIKTQKIAYQSAYSADSYFIDWKK